MPRPSRKSLLLSLSAVLTLGILVTLSDAADRKSKLRLEYEKNVAKREREREQQKQEEANFDSSKLPRPEVCFAKFLKAANSSTSMKTLYPYLPKADKENMDKPYTEEEKARKREWYTKNGTDPKTIEFFLMDPEKRRLDHIKSITKDIRGLVSTSFNGKTAKLRVTAMVTRTQNGRSFPYGSATVTMLAEDGTWKFFGYKESEVSYSSERALHEALGYNK